jgi:hypothetical protein
MKRQPSRLSCCVRLSSAVLILTASLLLCYAPATRRSRTPAAEAGSFIATDSPSGADGGLTKRSKGGDQRTRDPGQTLERTSFQTGGAYDPRLDIKADVAMVYGINGDLAERLHGWRDHGYITQVMTGVAWGEYQDYFSGQWDGRSHADEAQTDRDGNPILHGPTVPYVAPSESYGRYLCGGVKRAMDAGAEAIYLEEPEFWVRAGYSGSFQREWQAYYHEPWRPPHSSPDAQYRASKLKYFLYRRALQQVFDFVLDYNRQTGKHVRCYVPTHSMLNYAQWRIVSPEQSLVRLNGCDGYIGQVWTGTARTPNLYRGELKERTFETAFLEYGVLANLVRSTGRRMYYLNDPVEDNPDHTWEDYRRNWESTLVASLFWPEVWRYEVTPWPDRPFMGRYPTAGGGKPERVGIPPGYATELMTVFGALDNMKQPRVSWDCGTRGLGILVSDTMMFQRGEPSPSDPHLSSFYGLAMPLLKTGIPVQPVQMENLAIPGYLKPFRVLLLTYEGMKPPSPALHQSLAEWVRGGGVLVFVDDGSDPYNAVREWWNTGDLHYPSPAAHLFEQLGIGDRGGEYRIGRGAVIHRKVSPAVLARKEAGAETVIGLARAACGKASLAWKTTSSLILRRGPYVVAAGLDQSASTAVKTLAGRFVNLFDAKLTVVRQVALAPGSRFLLLDLDRQRGAGPRVLASASKVLDVRADTNRLLFHSEGPRGVIAATRVALPAPPKTVKAGSYPDAQVKVTWDAESDTALVEFPSAPEGVEVEVSF